MRRPCGSRFTFWVLLLLWPSLFKLSSEDIEKSLLSLLYSFYAVKWGCWKLFVQFVESAFVEVRWIARYWCHVKHCHLLARPWEQHANSQWEREHLLTMETVWEVHSHTIDGQHIWPPLGIEQNRELFVTWSNREHFLCLRRRGVNTVSKSWGGNAISWARMETAKSLQRLGCPGGQRVLLSNIKYPSLNRQQVTKKKHL